MQYNVAELLRGPVGATRRYPVDEVAQFDIEGAGLIGPLTGTIKLMRTQEGVLAEAELRAAIASECARCLKPIETEISIGFTDEYRPTFDIHTGLRIWPPPGEIVDDELMIGPEHILSLDEAARQELEAAIPVRLLCSEDCAGLCQRCGQDLNEGPCQCEPEIDSRWESLRDVLAPAATD